MHATAFARFALLLGLLAVAQPVAAQGDSFFERASRSRMKGPQSAPVLIYEISDFQCPFCAEFARTVYPRIDSTFIRAGHVQWVFVHLPMPNHANAWAASEASLCAGALGDRFWQMHDRIFASQDEWNVADDPVAMFARYASELGIPADAYADCVREDRVASLILADVIFAASTRVSGTPMFIINNERTIVGLKSFDEWQALLKKEIERKQ
ncbi:MAG TPA: thioredoxin domain-containing protein [Longimicrobiales bacterium]|nr:thioredoxin domain-containing protein [Longimicrobiales bacterium]